MACLVVMRCRCRGRQYLTQLWPGPEEHRHVVRLSALVAS